MTDTKIPEDLKEAYIITESNRHNIGTWSDMFVRGLIERSAKAENEVERLKSEIHAVIEGMPLELVVHVREGGGLEDETATLAVSVAKTTAIYELLKHSAWRLSEVLERR